MFFPCESKPPRDGDPAGRPNPRKSSEVRVVIEPHRIKGKKVRVEISAFGRICRNMIRESLRPSALAACTYSKLRVRRNSARTTPTSDIQPNSRVIHNSHQKLGCTTLERMISRNRVGIPDHTSMKR